MLIRQHTQEVHAQSLQSPTRDIGYHFHLVGPHLVEDRPDDFDPFLVEEGLVQGDLIDRTSDAALGHDEDLGVQQLRHPRIGQVEYSPDPGMTGTLDQGEVLQLREIARRTWRTFDDLVGPETNWLPSDNYQLSHVDELAPRTSPTNIGLYLLSVLGAVDFGYIPVDVSLHRLAATVSTLDKLQKYEGHLLNWYNLISLDPLVPRYVSTVDSGNLLACYWTLEQGIETLSDEPILGPAAFRGMADTVRGLLLAMEAAKTGGDMRRDAAALESLLSSEPPDLKAALDRLRRARKPAERLARALNEMSLEEPADEDAAPEDTNPVKEAAYWVAQVQP